ncbi:hypothetical protein EB796_006079 [Bugula neritina]|uniref:RalA-binding protein 1-like Ral binding domain-containing protein n=1 Tax=Bugula neritina TaxID=10212 RepID=A0A7J7KDK4_BUGNE|nr:hypothetical protein EB796_006079 [Bugula neritina]
MNLISKPKLIVIMGILYRPPLATAASKWSVDMPETAEAIEEELHKQESLLNKLHQELSHSHSLKNSEKEDRVWEVQRAVTQLKRKLKLIAKTQAARQLEQAQLATSKVQRADPNRRSINAAELNFALQSGSLRRTHRTSQAELASASSTASIAASTEGLHSLHKQSAAAEPSAVSSHPKKGAASEVPPTDPPSRDQFITDEPSASHLAADQPLAGHLAADQPLAGHLAADQPLAGHLAADQPLAGHLAADQPLPSSSPNNLPLSADVSNTTETGNEVKEDIQTSPQTQALPISEAAVQEPTLGLTATDQSEVLKPQTIQSLVPVQTSGLTMDPGTAMLLIPEKLHAGVDNSDANRTLESHDQLYNIADDDELRLLIAEEAQLIWEEEELIAIRHSSETMSSDEYYSSTSDTEPEDESAAQAELDNLVMTLMELTQQNEECEAKNAEMVKKIHEERMGCVNVKIQIRLLQQQMLGAQAEEQSLI